MAQLLTLPFPIIVDGRSEREEIVDAPRIHHQYLPDEVDYEPYALSPDTITLLKASGYTLLQLQPWGSAEGIVVDPTTGLLQGGTDSRAPAGSAAGYQAQ